MEKPAKIRGTANLAPVKRWVAFLLVAVAVCIAYSNTLSVPFIFDDHPNITENANFKFDSLSFEALKNAATEGRTNRPIAKITLALNYYFGSGNVFGFHVVNTLIHILNGFLVYMLAYCLLPLFDWQEPKETSGKNLYQWLALASAIIFVLHPLQTQSVTYIVQRMTSLCAAFYFGGLLCFIYGRQDLSRKFLWWTISLVLWLLALGTKEIAVMFPVTVLLLEWLVFQKGSREWILKNVRLLVLLVLTLGLVAFAFKGLDFFKLFTRGFSKRDFTLTERLLTQGRVIVHYISLVALPLPSRLTLVYDFPLSRSLLSPATTLISWCAITALVAGAVAYARQHRIACFCILWFFVHLAVESSILPLEMVYEHRLYVPLFGFCLFVPILVLKICKGHQSAAVIMVTVIAVGLAVGTFVRNQAWQSQITIWQDNAVKQPTAPRCHANLANAYAADGQLEKSFEAYSRTIEIEPDFQQAFVRRGFLWMQRGDFRNALNDFNQAERIDTGDIVGRPAIAECLTYRGMLLSQVGENDLAMKELNKAIESRPLYSKNYFHRAMTYLKLRNPKGAKDDFLKAIELDPKDPSIQNNFAWMLATYPDETVLDGAMAVRHATLACELTNWNRVDMVTTLAAAYARAGDFDNAVKWQKKFIELANEENKKKMQQRLQLYLSKQAYTHQ